MANDPINPNYYQFPSGAETIDITQFLTGNGAQATQYIVRSTRFDRELKGNPVEDLTKAIWFIEREISRLEDEADAEAASKAREELQGEDPDDRPCYCCGVVPPDPQPDVYNVTLNDAKNIASDGLDLDDAADEVGSADAKHVGIVRTAKVMASNAGLYL